MYFAIASACCIAASRAARIRVSLERGLIIGSASLTTTATFLFFADAGREREAFFFPPGECGLLLLGDFLTEAEMFVVISCYESRILCSLTFFAAFLCRSMILSDRLGWVRRVVCAHPAVAAGSPRRASGRVYSARINVSVDL